MVAPNHATTGAHPRQRWRWTARTPGSHSVKYSLGPLESEITKARSELDSAIDALVAWAESGDSTDDAQPSPGGTPSATASGAPTAGSRPSSGTTSTGTGSAPTQSAPTQSAASSAGSGGGDPMGQGSETVAQAQAAVDAARLDVTSAELALAGATLVAPADGVLTAFPFIEGGTASSSDVATVTTEGAVSVPIEVGEDDIASVKVGQEAVLGSATGGASEGSVAVVALLPTSGNSGSTWTVTILVGDPDAGLAVGTTATATVTIGSAANALLVPISALSLTGDRAGTVRVLAGGTETTTAVQLGVRGTTHVEVTDGLSVGDHVVLSDPSLEIAASTGSSRGITGMGGTGMGGMGTGGMRPGR